MIIYFTRHGETEWNKKKIVQGWEDSPLTERGIKSAEKKAKLLKSKNIEIIFSSDLGRCAQTAEIINKEIKVKIVKTKELRERNFGILNGKPGKEVKKTPPEGENLNDFRRRVVLFIKKLSSKKFNKVLLVAHDGSAKIISEIKIKNIKLWQV